MSENLRSHKSTLMPPLKPEWAIPSRFLEGPEYKTTGHTPSRRHHILAPSQEKVNLRLQVYHSFAPHGTVIELFAGKGTLTSFYASLCKRLIATEKDPEMFNALGRNLGEHKNVELYNIECEEWLEEAAIPEDTTYVDFDPYGCPGLVVQKFFQRHPVRRSLILAVTDGIAYNFLRMNTADLKKHYLQDFKVEYGQFQDHRALGEYMFEIQRRFIDILAMKYGAQAWPLYFKLNAQRSAFYSAYLVVPKIFGAELRRYYGLKAQHEKTGRIYSKTVMKTGTAAIS